MARDAASRGGLTAVLRYGVVVLVALAGGLTLLGLLDRFSPYLELATVFRLHYALLLGIAAVVAIPLRLVPLALAASLLAGINLLVISQVGTAARAGAGSDRLRALIVNVQEGNRDYDSVARLIAENDPDVVGVIELTPAWMHGLESALEQYRDRRLEPHEGAYGVGLYSRRRLASARIERFPANGSPSVVADVKLGERRVRFVLTHLHTPFAGGARRRQLRALENEIRGEQGAVIVCGDFNSVPWSQHIRDLAAAADLRSIQGRFGLAGTWPANARLLRIPFDNCLVGDVIGVADGRVGRDVGSDHLPLIVDFALVRNEGP